MKRLGDLLSHLLPEVSNRIGELVERIGRDAVERSIPIHGDFYEAQLLVSDGVVVGVLDVDTFGGGDPVTTLPPCSAISTSAGPIPLEPGASRPMRRACSAPGTNWSTRAT